MSPPPGRSPRSAPCASARLRAGWGGVPRPARGVTTTRCRIKTEVRNGEVAKDAPAPGKPGRCGAGRTRPEGSGAGAVGPRAQGGAFCWLVGSSRAGTPQPGRDGNRELLRAMVSFPRRRRQGGGLGAGTGQGGTPRPPGCPPPRCGLTTAPAPAVRAPRLSPAHGVAKLPDFELDKITLSLTDSDQNTTKQTNRKICK